MSVPEPYGGAVRSDGRGGWEDVATTGLLAWSSTERRMVSFDAGPDENRTLPWAYPIPGDHVLTEDGREGIARMTATCNLYVSFPGEPKAQCWRDPVRLIIDRPNPLRAALGLTPKEET